MSHYTGHVSQPLNAPRVKIAFVGSAIVAAGLVGFFSLQSRRHEKKHRRDLTGETSKISTWESRMIQHNDPVTENSATLRASRIENRLAPLPPVKKEHNSGHRTFGQDRLALSQDADTNSSHHIGSSPSFQVPTPQREGNSGSIYTKRPLWYESNKPSSGNRGPKMSGEPFKEKNSALGNIRQ